MRLGAIIKGLETWGVLWPPSHTINTHKVINSLIKGALQARPAIKVADENWNVCKRLLLDGKLSQRY